ncbi:hypothetical protein BLOT_001124 [Blomia tropicalis]|nr:hypothetical protein BLOT_001124 [Blomia tropicalis]
MALGGKLQNFPIGFPDHFKGVKNKSEHCNLILSKYNVQTFKRRTEKGETKIICLMEQYANEGARLKYMGTKYCYIDRVTCHCHWGHRRNGIDTTEQEEPGVHKLELKT